MKFKRLWANTISWDRRRQCVTEDYANEDLCQESSAFHGMDIHNILYGGLTDAMWTSDVNPLWHLIRLVI